MEQMNNRDSIKKRVEDSAIVGNMCPIINNYATTYHHAQGSTHRNFCLMDLEKLSTTTSRCDPASVASCLLVGVTRPKFGDMLALSNVPQVQWLSKMLRSDNNLKKSVESRKAQQCKIKYTHLR